MTEPVGASVVDGPFRLKRIYEPVEPEDGCRVLVDRLWPRGVSKERAALDEWAKDLAPSTALREQFGHHRERFDDFRVGYLAELQGNPGLERLRRRAHGGLVTLLYAARDTQVNHAVVLRDALNGLVA